MYQNISKSSNIVDIIDITYYLYIHRPRQKVMGIMNNKSGGAKTPLRRLFLLCALSFLLIIFASEARADAAKDKLAYAQKRYEDLQKSEKRKSSKSLWLDVIKQFESVVRNYPNSEEAPKALFTEGVIYREMFNYSITLGELYKSEKTFKRFLRKYPKHPLCEEARKNINEIKEQKKKNNLIRVSTVKPNPNDFPGRDKVLPKDKGKDKSNKKTKKFIAKKKSPPPEKPDKTYVAKNETKPPDREGPIETRTVKYEVSPKKKEPPKISSKIDIARAAPPGTTRDKDSTKVESPGGTGGDYVPEGDPSLPTGWESSENVKLGTVKPPPGDKKKEEVVIDRKPPAETGTTNGAPHQNRPNKSTADLPSPPRQPPLLPPSLAEVMTIRYFSDTDHTRIVVDTNAGIAYKGASLPEDIDVGIGPRIYIDLFDTRLSPGLDSPITIGDGLVDRIRWSQNKDKVVRVVLDLDDEADYKVFTLKNPNRVVIDVLRN